MHYRYASRYLFASLLNGTFYSAGIKIVLRVNMMLRHFFLSTFFLAFTYTSFCQTGLTPVWDNGLKFKSADGATTLSVGGRMHYDVAFINHSKELDSLAGPAKDKLEVRRARLSFEGTLKNAVKYEFEFTFGENIQYADLYVAFLKVPFFEQVTAGHFREPFGMEENTSSNSIVFMERSLTSSFAPGRNAGLMAQRTFFAKRMRVYAGVFRLTNPLGSDLEAKGKHSFSGRVAYFPVWDSARNKALHLGLSANLFSPPDNRYFLNVENTTHTGDTYIKSGEITDVQHVKNIGGEMGYAHKRFALQSEYMHSFVRIRRTIATEWIDRLRDFNSFYAMASFFIGKGQRRYDRNRNSFSSIKIEGSEKNTWELALRYSRIHLRESIENIRKMSDITVGLNWYYSETWRIMFNYIHSEIQDNYKANSFQMRLQATF